MATVKLPKTNTEVLLKFVESIRNEPPSSVNINYKPPTEENSKTIRSYTESALLAGRPLASALIVLAGYSGAGKSTLINKLLDDPHMCPTNSFTSETKQPTVLQKSFDITDLSPPITGKLTIVDVPGTMDSDLQRDIENTHTIRKFLSVYEELAERPFINQLVPEAPCIVHPNIVLFVMKATDNRIIGNNTALRKSLDQLKALSKLVDENKCNLIVVLTHACALGLNKALFERDMADRKVQIRSVIFEVLGITDVDIVPVENEPERYQLKKRGDFYILPNHERSHLNLIQSMLKQFDQNGDILGRLFVGWYLGPNCSEKQAPMEIVNWETMKKTSDQDESEGPPLIIRSNRSQAHVHHLKLLGYGFCPVKEELKLFSLLENVEGNPVGNCKLVPIGNKHFVIPITVQAFSNRNRVMQKMTFYNQPEYEKHMKSSYGFQYDVDFHVSSLDLSRRWMGGNRYDAVSCKSYAIKHQMASLKMDIEKGAIQNKMLLQYFDDLSEKYDEETADAFSSFFDAWGTHFISEVPLGALIQFDCALNKSNFLDESKLFDVIKNLFSCELLDNRKVNQQLECIGASIVHVKIEGGAYAGKWRWEDLLSNSSAISDFTASAETMPSELVHGINIFPYYGLLAPGKIRDSLRAATLDYISGNFKQSSQVYEKSHLRAEISNLAIHHAEKLASRGTYVIDMSSLTDAIN